MQIPGVGRQMDMLMARLLRRDMPDILASWTRQLAAGRLDAIKRFAVHGFGAGALANWRNHAVWLAGIGSIPNRERLERLVDGAHEYAERVEARALAVFAREQPLTPEAYIRLLAGVTVRNGWQRGGEEAAAEGEAEFKQWIRAYPTKERREWHDRLNGTALPRGEKFVLPGGPNAGRSVDGPHDWKSVSDPREHINCGHAVIYTRAASVSALIDGARNNRV